MLRRIKYEGANQINKDDLKGPPHIRDFVLTCNCIKRTLSMRLKNQEHVLITISPCCEWAQHDERLQN
jgi:hypothetical protein